MATIEKLEGGDFIDLNPDEKLLIIWFLAQELLQTFSFEDLLREKQAALTEAFKKKQAASGEYTRFHKENEEQAKAYDMKANNPEPPPEEAAAATEPDPAEEEPPIVVNYPTRTSRQHEIELRKQKKEKEETEKAAKIAAENAYYRLVTTKEKTEAEYVKLCSLVERLQRLTPLGYDRNHSRYWFFNSACGLLVERCWAPEHFYEESPELPAIEPKLEATDTQEEIVVAKDDDQSVPGESITSDAQSSSSLARADMDARLLPRLGQNTWGIYSSMEQIHRLLSCLYEHGFREKPLKAEIKRMLPEIEKSMLKAVGRSIISAEMAKKAAEVAAPAVVDLEKPAEDNSAAPVDDSLEDDELPHIADNHYLLYLQSECKDLLVRLFNGGLCSGRIDSLEARTDKCTTMNAMVLT